MNVENVEVDRERVIADETIPGGAYWTRVLRRGTSLRIVDLEGCQGNINFFMNVPVTEAGHLDIVDGISNPGSYVEMRAEMDVLCVISNCPQINNPCNGWNPTPIRLLVWDSL